MSDLHVTEWGDGDPAVLVHGSLGWGDDTWSAQRPLAARYRLILPDRRGFGASPGPEAGDWETDAGDVAALLPERAHLVGHSYGGVVALLAAARRPEAVRSLCVVEPPALGLVRGRPAVGRGRAARRTRADELPEARRARRLGHRGLRGAGSRPARFHAVCDVLEERLGAAGVTIPGAAHNPLRSGETFNSHLLALWEAMPTAAIPPEPAS